MTFELKCSKMLPKSASIQRRESRPPCKGRSQWEPTHMIHNHCRTIHPGKCYEFTVAFITTRSAQNCTLHGKNTTEFAPVHYSNHPGKCTYGRFLTSSNFQPFHYLQQHCQKLLPFNDSQLLHPNVPPLNWVLTLHSFSSQCSQLDNLQHTRACVSRPIRSKHYQLNSANILMHTRHSGSFSLALRPLLLNQAALHTICTTRQKVNKYPWQPSGYPHTSEPQCGFKGGCQCTLLVTAAGSNSKLPGHHCFCRSLGTV